jgi:hypothetical protein
VGFVVDIVVPGQVFPCQYHFTVAFHTQISVGGRSSDTWSYSIDMNKKKNNSAPPPKPLFSIPQYLLTYIRVSCGFPMHPTQIDEFEVEADILFDLFVVYLTAIFNRVGYTAPSSEIAKCELEIYSGK